ncbi:hypothetical protein BCR32DRAFT_330788, partial [Anaeromyces robustus]
MDHSPSSFKVPSKYFQVRKNNKKEEKEVEKVKELVKNIRNKIQKDHSRRINITHSIKNMSDSENSSNTITNDSPITSTSTSTSTQDNNNNNNLLKINNLKKKDSLLNYHKSITTTKTTTSTITSNTTSNSVQTVESKENKVDVDKNNLTDSEIIKI